VTSSLIAIVVLFSVAVVAKDTISTRLRRIAITMIVERRICRIGRQNCSTEDIDGQASIFDENI
jgi:hypothetical protein